MHIDTIWNIRKRKVVRWYQKVTVPISTSTIVGGKAFLSQTKTHVPHWHLPWSSADVHIAFCGICDLRNEWHLKYQQLEKEWKEKLRKAKEDPQELHQLHQLHLKRFIVVPKKLEAFSREKNRKHLQRLLISFWTVAFVSRKRGMEVWMELQEMEKLRLKLEEVKTFTCNKNIWCLGKFRKQQDFSFKK